MNQPVEDSSAWDSAARDAGQPGSRPAPAFRANRESTSSRFILLFSDSSPVVARASGVRPGRRMAAAA
jgi:hypothetical protein